MIKKIFITIIINLFLVNSVFAAGSGGSGGDGSSKKTNYEKAVKLIKSAKKYESKGKSEKAKKDYEKAQEFLIKSNKKNLTSQTLNYLVLPLGNLETLKMEKILSSRFSY